MLTLPLMLATLLRLTLLLALGPTLMVPVMAFHKECSAVYRPCLPHTELTLVPVPVRRNNADPGLCTLQAYDPRFGARPLRRWLEHNVVTELSRMVIGGSLPDNSIVTVDDAGAGAPQRLSYSVKPGEAPATSNGNSANRTGNGGKRGRMAMDYAADDDDDEEEEMLE